MLDKACQSVPALAIAVDTPTKARIHMLASGVREAREEMTNVQRELNLQIAELRLKAQPSTPLEVREQHICAIITGLEEIRGVVQDCTSMLEQALEVLTTLQEDPNIQRLETKARELQQQYDSIRGTAQTVILTQLLARMQQAKALKEQVDAARHKEVVLKASVQPFDEAFMITAQIEGKLAHIQGMHA